MFLFYRIFISFAFILIIYQLFIIRRPYTSTTTGTLYHTSMYKNTKECTSDIEANFKLKKFFNYYQHYTSNFVSVAFILVLLKVHSPNCYFKTLPPKLSEPLFLDSLLSPKENPFPREYFPFLGTAHFKIGENNIM